VAPSSTIPVCRAEVRRIARSLTRHAADITFVFDLDAQQSVYASRSVANLLGYSPAQARAIENNLLPSLVHPEDLPRILAHWGQFKEKQDSKPVELEYRARHANGQWCWIRSREVVFKRHQGGVPRQILGTSQDITERKHAEDAVRCSEARLAEAQSIARIGSWEYDAQTGGTFWSEEMLRIFGFDPQDGNPGYAPILDCYHPEDRIRHDRVVAESIAAGTGFAMDLRILLPGGAVRWCHAMGQPVFDEQGTLLRVVGTVMDITDRKLSDERFHVLFEYSSEANLLLDEGKIIDCNSAAVKLLHCTGKAQLLGLHPSVLSPPRQPDGRLSGEKAHEMDALAYAQGCHQFEWTHRTRNGDLVPVAVTLTPVPLRDKSALLAVCHDLTERKAAEQQIKDYSIVLECKMAELEAANTRLEALATLDGLTELKNHRAFQERLTEEFVRARRCRAPLSVVLLDVDQFKQYNDAFGHPAGDAVLRQVACLLQKTARESDFVARYGGEEFVVILPATDEHGARRMAERCRDAVASAVWPHRPVTISLGVASNSMDIADSSTLVVQADQALYAAKVAGCNQVGHAPMACSPADVCLSQ